jgi:signal transduction histidine kinase/CheY-like chemotaxis protein
MMGRILLGQREQDRAQHALAALNASLEERVALRTRELEIARDDALAAARSKEQFLSSMSHEIRTPMNGMLGAMELLSSTGLTAAQARLIHVAAISGEALLDIINQVLDYAKMGAGHLHLQREAVDVNDIARSVLTLFSAAAQRKSIEIRLDADPALSGWRLGDALRIRQVLMNLVGNALKFTQHGEIVIRTRLLGKGQDERVELQVADTGNGIDPSLHARIFDAFVQVGDPSQWRQGGTGLGLAISREIARAMGGELSVQSDVGKGATFRLVAAFERAPEPVPEVRAARSDPAGKAPLSGRVLLVEDNSVNRLVGSAMLESLGLEVASAENGEIALAMLASGTFAAVLMDCQMPVMDGYEATQRIREREKMTGAKRMPIIALTANALRADVERCLAAGMDAHLGKPFNLGQLRAVVAPWLSCGTA